MPGKVLSSAFRSSIDFSLCCNPDRRAFRRTQTKVYATSEGRTTHSVMRQNYSYARETFHSSSNCGWVGDGNLLTGCREPNRWA